MQFSFDLPGENNFQSYNKVDEEPIGSDRLKKAIERNRAKRMRKEGQSYGDSFSTFTSETIGTGSKSNSAKSSYFKNDKKSTLDIVPTRRSVAKPDHVEFVAPIKISDKAPSDVQYARKKKTSTKKRFLSDRVQQLLIKFGWVCIVGLFIRLTLTEGGIVDFISMENTLNGKKSEISNVVLENKNLVKEIKKIKQQKSYQMQLAREHLGVISEDEYLILFSNESKPRKILTNR